ncbi:Kazal-type serine protease inhibitor domain-containing protein [Phyllobacterium sophorae]|uniref:Protease inhibitor n=1 Tax=Phyllobacterium sophorae TaxID=1520277 RepID=A0A2P7BDC2_9HYPH|nr:Kazal-type serine protease inhibitor domain-containing protein [Phyllobacterium sophorae]PSH64456.1 protease inhibitor [Phyllobacterium sophorae]
MQAEPRNFLRIGAIMAVAVIAANCTVSVEDSGPHHPRPERPQICTREYAPVCGVRNSERQTFGNACEARSKGYRIIGSGKCSFQDRPDSGWDGRRDRPEQPRMCTLQYAPVCARRGTSVQTFGNTCEAGNAGYQVIGEGRC